MKLRQEVLNVYLAYLLSKLGLHVSSERIHSKKAPDFTIYHPLLGVVLGEAEIGEDILDESAKKKKLEERTREKLTNPAFNFINFVLLVIYPKELVDTVSSCIESKIPRMLRKSHIGLGLAYKVAITTTHDVKIKCVSRPVHPTEMPSILGALAHGIVKELTGSTLMPEEIIDNMINIIESYSKYARSLQRERSGGNGGSNLLN